MASEKASAKIGGLGVCYILSWIGFIALSYGLFGQMMTNNTLQVGTIYAKVFSVCNVLVIPFGIICMICYCMRRKALYTVQMFAFCVVLIGYGLMAFSAFQEEIMPVVMVMLLAICFQAILTFYIKKSKQVASAL